MLIVDYSVGVFGCYEHECLRECLDYIVVYLVPNCGVGYFLGVVQIMVEVL